MQTEPPDDTSLEDLQYYNYVRQRVDQGLVDADAGRVVSHEEAMRRLDKWRAFGRRVDE